MPAINPTRAAFRKLHEDGCFVMPNPWDPGSTKYLCRLGFRAVATTSAGFSFSQGLPDSCMALALPAVLAHVADIVRAAGEIPVNADFQSGYAPTAEGVAESVRRCIATGVAGISIEDATGDPQRPLYELPEAVERLAAARAAIDASGSGVMLTARAECFLVGHADPLRESLRRLEAYAAAGADVLFAPGPCNPDNIRAIVAAAGPKPVNAIVTANTPLRVGDLAELGVRRISVGSALARAAWAGFFQAIRPLATEGSFRGLEGAATFAELNGLFG